MTSGNDTDALVEPSADAWAHDTWTQSRRGGARLVDSYQSSPTTVV